MNRTDALRYVSFAIDDSLYSHPLYSSDTIPDNARLIGWQCGFEPLFVAVFSYLPGVALEDGEAEEIARDFLEERGWFGTDSNDSRPADYVL